MQFNIINIIASMPEIIVIAAACLLLMVDLFLSKRQKHLMAYLAIAVVIIAAIQTWRIEGVRPLYIFDRLFVVDSFATFFKTIFYLSTFLAILLSMNYIKIEDIEHSEYYILMLFALSGMMIMASGADLITIYLGLELMALPVYLLTGFMRKDIRSNEAAMKYIVLGALSSGILLYGISLIYGLTGTTQLSYIAASLKGGAKVDSALILATIFLIAGFGFKVAAVPFHMWLPDAYEGAPTSITAFMSVGPKVASFAFLLRMFLVPLGGAREQWLPLLVGVAIATMTLGNLAAISQSNIKRLLAYSAISHVGYLLLGLVAGNDTGLKGISIYLLVYAFMNLGAFTVIVAMRRRDLIGDEIEDMAGLMYKSPVAAVLMMIFLLSLAGIPPTAGFLGKYFIFLSLIESQHFTLAVMAVLYVAVALYYYFR